MNVTIHLLDLLSMLDFTQSLLSMLDSIKNNASVPKPCRQFANSLLSVLHSFLSLTGF
ncbi:hypothetical protein KP509_29G047000 [Ceratopteris richardii]|uniref:Uncharacterized protein n=1 Tax=Ceratopteris richardii TaxID=49495 RepID=A0A8T2R8E8_CERRI|nr:hypothetical protein KP509_29G047000 [Ceratopteris richardii]